MNDKEYISTRVDEQINWYDKKSQHAQTWFKRLRAVEIIAAALIPLLAGFTPETFPTLAVVSILGTFIAIASSLISLNQFQENWIEYRTACESLRHEKLRYLTNASPYNLNNPFSLFVERVENLISKENSAWSNYTNETLNKNHQELQNSAE